MSNKKCYFWIMLVIMLGCFAVTASAAEKISLEQQLNAKLADLNQAKLEIAKTQADYDNLVQQLQAVEKQLAEKQAAYEKVSAENSDNKEELAKLADAVKAAAGETKALGKAKQQLFRKLEMLKRQQNSRIIDALEMMAAMYDTKAAQTWWVEERSEMIVSPAAAAADIEKQVLAAADKQAWDKAAKHIKEMLDTISPPETLTILQNGLTVSGKAEKVQEDPSGGFGKTTKKQEGENAKYSAAVRLQFKPAAENPYRDLARQWGNDMGVLVPTDLGWEGKLVYYKQNGEPGGEQKVDAVVRFIADGRLHLPAETAQRDYQDITSRGSYQLVLMLTMPESIDGDAVKVEFTYFDTDVKGLKRVGTQVSGEKGSGSFEYETYMPPIITLSAGSTMLPKSRLRVGESVIRFSQGQASVVAWETKDGEVSAYSNGKLIRKMKYLGQIGPIKALLLNLPGTAVLENVKVYQQGSLVLAEEFDIDGAASVQVKRVVK